MFIIFLDFLIFETQFESKIRATNLQKSVFIDNYFPVLLEEVNIWLWKVFKLGLGRFFRKIK